jgi:hypothetical protein
VRDGNSCPTVKRAVILSDPGRYESFCREGVVAQATSYPDLIQGCPEDKPGASAPLTRGRVSGKKHHHAASCKIDGGRKNGSSSNEGGVQGGGD